MIFIFYFFYDRKIRYVLYVQKKYKKVCLRRGFHSRNKFMLHVLNKTTTQQIQLFMIFFFISKFAKKIRSVSKEDTNQFLI